MDIQAYRATHPVVRTADYADLVETVGLPFTDQSGRSVSAHEVAVTIRESRANGIHAANQGDVLELLDDRGRCYGYFTFPTI